MLSYRQVLILSYILSMKDGVQLSSLVQALDVSDKTIKNEISEINKLLPEKGQIQQLNKKGYFIEQPSDEIYVLMESSFQSNKEEYVDKDRTNRILMILLFEKEYISMEALAQRLFLSKSMLNKLMDISWRLRKYIEVSPTKGLRLPWSESKKRNFLAKSFILSSSALEMVQQDTDFLGIMDVLQQIMQEVILRHQYTVSGEAFATFHRYISATIIRSNGGFLLEEEVAELPISQLMKEIHLEIQQRLGIKLNDKDLWSCQKKLNELNVLYAEKRANPQGYMEELEQHLTQFVVQVKKLFRLSITMSSEQKNNFLLHMYKLKIRNDNGNDVANFNKRLINESYPFTAQVIRDCFLPIFQLNIRESEVSYIILYFAEFLEFSKKKQTVLLISDSTPSLIYDTQRKLRPLLAEAYQLRSIPQYKYLADSDGYNRDSLAILTTEVAVIIKNHRALLINKVLLPEDYELIDMYLDGYQRYEKKALFAAGYKQFVTKKTIDDKKHKRIFDFLPPELLGDYPTYDLVLNTDIGYFASFTKEKSQIRILELTKPVLYKDHHLKKIVLAAFNPETTAVHEFYPVIHQLIRE